MAQEAYLDHGRINSNGLILIIYIQVDRSINVQTEIMAVDFFCGLMMIQGVHHLHLAKLHL